MSSNTISASIIIPVYNKVEYTEQCIEKLYEDADPEIDVEIIVVDNNSQDGTEQYLKQKISEHANVKYLKMVENLGFAKACNHGALVASGEYLIFLNNDTLPKPGWLKFALERLRSNPEIGIVGSKLLYPDGTIQHCGIEFFGGVNPDHTFWPLHRYLREDAAIPQANISEEVTAVTGACLTIRKNLFWKVDGFDESYGMYFEDTDLNFKVRKAGFKIFYEPKSVVVHYEGASSKDQTAIDALNKKAGDKFFKKWAKEVSLLQLKKHVAYEENNFVVIDENIYPDVNRLDLTDQPDAMKFTNEISILLTKINAIDCSYVHFGGAGDALLLLSTYYDEHPEATIVSFANSISSLKSFWKTFPQIKKLYLFPVPTHPLVHTILRKNVKQSSKVLGMGTTPSESYFEEWNEGINIFEKYGVKKNPVWASAFAINKIKKQVAVAPMGSMVGMVGSKKNIIDPKIWKKLLKFLIGQNFQPVLLGTPPESKMYPVEGNCLDKRSYNFKEQMEIIASSEFFIGADSWGKTFAALAGIPAIVFKAMVGADLKDWKDNSDFVFLDPWENISVVNNFNEFQGVFTALTKAKRETTAKRFSIIWEGPQFVNHSLALVNRELCVRLAEENDLALIKTEKDTFKLIAGSKYNSLSKCCATLNAVDVHVRHHWPPNLTAPEKGHWVVIQPWEFGSLPRQWAEVFSSKVDEMWVPSNYVRQIYLDAGIAPERVFVVPNGIDPQAFNASVKPYKLKTKKKFKFLFVGGTIYRKGIDVLVNAYLAVFKNSDDVCLVIKDFGGDSFYKGQTIKEKIQKIKAEKNSPEIEYIDKTLSEKEIAGLYTACDALVHPYRGEGFGLPILEAMASGLPVIVTNGGACLDFCNDENSLLIDAEKKYFSEKNIGSNETVDFPWLYEPSLEHLKERLQFAASHPEKLKMLGKKGEEFSHSYFTWNHSAKIVTERLHQLNKKPVVRWAASAELEINQLKLSAGDFPKLFNEFVTAIEEGSVASAINLTDELFAAYSDEKHAEVISFENLLNLSGNINLAAGNLENANRYFENQLNLNPNSSSACLGLGEVFFSSEKYSEAKTMFEWAVKNDAENLPAATRLKNVNELLGLDADQNSLEEPVSLDEQIEKLFAETYELYEQKYFDEALTILAELEKFVQNNREEIHPDTLVSITNLAGYNYLGLGEIDNARESFEKALTINPTSSSACAGLGEMYAVYEMNREAKTMFEWAVKNNPENQSAITSLSHVNRKLGFAGNHNSLVLQNVDPLREIEKKLDSAEALISSDNNDQAEILLNEVLALEPNNVIALNNIAVIQIIKEEYDEAVKTIIKALAINPEDTIALGNLDYLKNKITPVLQN